MIWLLEMMYLKPNVEYWRSKKQTDNHTTHANVMFSMH